MAKVADSPVTGGRKGMWVRVPSIPLKVHFSGLIYIIKNSNYECSLLCRNCHREKHINLDFFNSNIDLIVDKSKNLKELNPPVDVNMVIEMYKSGKRQFEIRKELGVAKSTISGILKKYKGYRM